MTTFEGNDLRLVPAPANEPGLPWVKIAIWLSVIALLVVPTWLGRDGARRSWEVRQSGERIKRCTAVPEVTVAALTPHIQNAADYTIRGWRAARSETAGRVFVTAELIHRDLAAGAEGELATWVTASLDPVAPFAAVDENALELSTLPNAAIAVSEPSVIDSRFCTFKARNKVWRDPSTLSK